MPDSQYNIGPSAIADPGTKGGPKFVLSKTEWVAVQTFVADALDLPITDEEFRESLGPGAPVNLSDFEKLIAAYQDIHSHCSAWKGTTFPRTVALASKVYEYGSSKAPVFYPPILQQAEILRSNPNDQSAKDTLKAILDNLHKQAKDYAEEAGAVEKEVKAFADQTEDDRTTLIGPKGDGGLRKYYNEKYGSASKEIEELTGEIAAQREIVQSANDEYNHDVIVATTTPTYGWWFPLGTVAAAVVAGVYGDKAVKALNRARAAQEKIDTLTDKLEADANLLTAINSAMFGASTIVQEISAALPVVQKIRGVWGGIAADLAHIVDLIDKDISQVPPIIMSLGVDEALKAWYDVALFAGQWRTSAYVQQSGNPSLDKDVWRVKRIMSARRAHKLAA